MTIPLPVPGGPLNGTGKSTQPEPSKGGSYVWSDDPISLGPIQLGFGTRVLKDIGVGIVAVVLIVLGFVLLAKPDISQLAKSADVVPIPV